MLSPYILDTDLSIKEINKLNKYLLIRNKNIFSTMLDTPISESSDLLSSLSFNLYYKTVNVLQKCKKIKNIY
jgi:hypothetical protein